MSKLPEEEKGVKRPLGTARGRLIVPPDFNAPLPDDLLAAFEGDELASPKQSNQDSPISEVNRKGKP